MKIFTRLLSLVGLCLLLLPMQPLEAQRAKQGSAQRTELKTEIDQAQRLSQPKKLATLSAQLVELSIQEQSYPDLLIGLHHLRSAHRDLYGDLDRRPIFEQLDRARRQTWLRAEERSLLLAYIYHVYRIHGWNSYEDRPRRQETDALVDTLDPSRWTQQQYEERTQALAREALANLTPLSRRVPEEIIPLMIQPEHPWRETYAALIFHTLRSLVGDNKEYWKERIRTYAEGLPIGRERMMAEYEYLYFSSSRGWRREFKAEEYKAFIDRYERHSEILHLLPTLLPNAHNYSTRAQVEHIDRFLKLYPSSRHAASIRPIKSLREELLRPNLSVDLGSNVVVGRREQVVCFEHQHLQACRISVYQAPTIAPIFIPERKQMKLVKTFTYQLREHEQWDRSIDTLVLKDSQLHPTLGQYYIQITPIPHKRATKGDFKGWEHRYLDYQLTNKYPLWHKPHAGEASSLQWFDGVSGEPLSGERIHYFTPDSVRTLLQADQEGMMTLPKSERKGLRVADHQGFFVSLDAFDPLASQHDNYGNYMDSPFEGEVSAFVTSDRGAYRPGDTVQIYGYLFREEPLVERSRVLPHEELSLRLITPSSQEHFSVDVETDALGRFTYSFVAPKDQPRGSYDLRVVKAGKRLREASFSIEEYKAPTFELQIPEIPEVRPERGDTIRIEVRAVDLTGARISGVRLSAEVNVSEGYRYYRAGIHSPRGHANSFEIKEVETDEEGRAQLSFVFDPIEPEGTDQIKYHWISYSFEIKAVSTTGEAQTQETYLTLPVGKPSAVEIDLPEYLDASLLEQPLKIRVMQRHQKPDPQPLAVRYEILGQGKVVHQGGGQTGEEINLAPHTASLPSGKYQICTEAQISSGKVLRDTTNFVLYRPTDERMTIDNEALWVRAVRDYYDEKHPPRLLVASSLPTSYISYRVSVDGRTHSMGHFRSEAKKLHHLVIDLKGRSQSVVVDVYMVHNARLYKRRLEYEYRLPNRELELRWQSFRNRVRAGSHETWSLQILKDGKPVRAALAAWMFDSALDKVNGLYLDRFAPVQRPIRGSYGIDHLFEDQFFPNSISTPRSYESYWDVYGDWYDGCIDYSSGVGQRRSLGRMIAVGSLATRFAGRVSGVIAMQAPKSLESEEEDASMGVLHEPEIEIDRSALPDALKELGNSSRPAPSGKQPVVRRNFSPLAFFRPRMQSNSSGEVSWSFDLPEALTRWRVELVAHTEDLSVGHRSAYVESYRELMLRPFLPRQLRQGDHASLSTQLYNSSDKAQKGKITLELFDLRTERILLSEQKSFSLEPQKGQAYHFSFDTPKGLDSVGVRLMAQGKNFSDGEQHALAILPAIEETAQGLAFTLQKAERRTISLAELYPTGTFRPETGRFDLRLESNPLFIALESLPSIVRERSTNAISLSANLFTQVFARHIALTPGLESWAQERAKALGLSLRAGRDSLLLLPGSEGPWSEDLREERRRASELFTFLDSAKREGPFIEAELVKQLAELQQPDGKWSWFSGMSGNIYVTTVVMRQLLRLRQLLPPDRRSSGLEQMISKGWAPLEAYVSEVMSEEQAQGAKSPNYFSGLVLDYLYLLELAPEARRESNQSLVKYHTDRLRQMALHLPLYDKPRAAMALRRAYPEVAKLVLESLRQHLVEDEVGEFFAKYSSTWGYWWINRNYTLITEFIEALQLIAPEDEATVISLRQWLLNQRRSVGWESEVASVEALYALLSGSGAEALKEMNKTELTLVLSDGSRQTKQGERIDLSLRLKRTEYPDKLEVQTQRDGQVWGAVVARYPVPIDSLRASGRELSIERRLFIKTVEGGETRLRPLDQGHELRVGDILLTQIYIKLERDIDFVSLSDPRMGFAEPTQQLSHMRAEAGTLYYYEPKDKQTNFYFEHLNRGEYRLEYEQHVVRSGVYQAVSAQVQSTYAPEYTATTGFGGRITVREQTQ